MTQIPLLQLESTFSSGGRYLTLAQFQKVDFSQHDTVVSALRSLVQSGWLDAFISEELVRLDRDRNHIPNMDGDQAVLLRNKVLSLTVKFFELSSLVQ